MYSGRHLTARLNFNFKQHSMHPAVRRTIESAYATEREQGFLELGAMRSDAAFVAAETIAASGGLKAIEGCPAWLVVDLLSSVRHYLSAGSLTVVSNLGEADHSQLYSEVAKHLPGLEALAPPNELLTHTISYPNGRVHKHYSWYAAADGSEVRHGLFREYGPDGELAEVEYLNGTAQSAAQRFTPDGRPFPHGENAV
jgi:hypothetical protein